MAASAQTEAIASRIQQIRQTVPDTVRLIAISKQVSPDLIRAAYQAGIRDFGESRVQEALPKRAELAELDGITWHFIGHIQSNKAAKVVEHFDWIHSIDSLKLALKIDQIAQELAVFPKGCLQVKLRPDPNKFGWSAAELLHDLPQLKHCSYLQILGLMVIPPYGLDPAETLSIFTEARDLATTIRQQSNLQLELPELSMGMSDDYPLAIQAGSTMIRLGRIIFGDRN